MKFMVERSFDRDVDNIDDKKLLRKLQALLSEITHGKEWRVNTGITIFSQIMDFLPMHEFRRIYSRPVDKSLGLICDQTIGLSNADCHYHRPSLQIPLAD